MLTRRQLSLLEQRATDDAFAMALRQGYEPSCCLEAVREARTDLLVGLIVDSFQKTENRRDA